MYELSSNEKEQDLGWSFSTLNQGSMHHHNPSWEIITGLWDRKEPTNPVIAVFYDIDTGLYHVASCDMTSTWSTGIGMWQPSNIFYAGSSDNSYEIIELVKNTLTQTDKYTNYTASDVISLTTYLLEEAI